MEIEKKYATLGPYDILRELGSGYTSDIMLGYDSSKNEYCALKILKENHLLHSDRSLRAEVQSLQIINHPNIIKMHGVKQGEYVKKDLTKKNVIYIELEFAEGGTLFDYVANTKPFSEEVCRYYFHQFIEAILHCHKSGFVHRDIKPENILFDKDYQLKLADFGFSKVITNEKLKSYLGTEAYMAPEIKLGMQYNGQCADLFAAAIVLFIMYSGTPAFCSAVPGDPYYRLICTNKHDEFWEIHSRNKPGKEKFYSKDFKNLMNGILSFDPVQRPSLSEIKNHIWYKGKVPSKKKIINEFRLRQQIVETKHGEELEQRILQEKQQKVEQIIEMDGKHTYVNNGIFRSITKQEFEGLLKQFPGLNKKRQLDDFVKMGSGLNFYYTSAKPHVLLCLLLLSLNKDQNCSTIQFHAREYQIKCTLKDEFGNICICIKITQDKKTSNRVVEFKKISGQLIRYYDKVNEIKENILSQLLQKDQEKIAEITEINQSVKVK